MNVDALRQTQVLGFDYCSDGRGTHPHLPVWNAELIRCPQLPTTLPTLDELIGIDGATADDAAGRLLALTAPQGTDGPLTSHVFTLHAELEGLRLAPTLERLLNGWKAQGYRLSSLRRLYETFEPMALPRCEVGMDPVPGRSGTLLCQRREFLSDVDLVRAA
jgi:peptidoglycan/xylan/chitin deacetylase (PgdA/CDA1 family)